MFLDSFKVMSLAVIQVFLLGAIGYFLVKKNIIGSQGISTLTQLVIKVTLPIFIFCQLVRNFNFSLYSDWWVFPLISVGITLIGFVVGALFTKFIQDIQYKRQLLSLVTFQNAGYLPLALTAALLPKDKTASMFIYIFLFLLGFNLTVWSIGVSMLAFSKTRRFEWESLFSPPVIATIFSLLFIFFGLNKFLSEIILKPLEMVGDCTLPLAILIVGGNLAEIQLIDIHKKEIFLMILAKLVILPILGLLLVMRFRLPQLLRLLILIQLAMPPATSLSIIIRHYKKEDLLISQGIFFGHLASLITVPLFLSLYHTFAI